MIKKKNLRIVLLTVLALLGFGLLSVASGALDCKDYQAKCYSFRDAKWFGNQLKMAQYKGTTNYNVDVTSLVKCCISQDGAQYTYYPVTGDDGYKCPYCLNIAAEKGQAQDAALACDTTTNPGDVISHRTSDDTYFVDGKWQKAAGTAKYAEGKYLPYIAGSTYSGTYGYRKCILNSKDVDEKTQPPAQKSDECKETLTGPLGGSTTSRNGKHVEFEAVGDRTRIKIGTGVAKIYSISGVVGSFEDADNILGNGANARICVTVSSGGTQLEKKAQPKKIAPKPSEGAKMKGGCRLDVTFGIGEPKTATQEPPNKGTIEEYATKVKDMPVTSVNVYGFSSTELFRGKGVEESKNLNEELSKLRADVVASVLTKEGLGSSTTANGQVVLFSDDFGPNRRAVISTEPLSSEHDFIDAMPLPGAISGDCSQKPKKVAAVSEGMAAQYKIAQQLYAECESLEKEGKLAKAALRCEDAAVVLHDLLQNSPGLPPLRTQPPKATQTTP
ncbi:hypothetical protein HY772_01745 [Candidatus Woesearchaeota archaeon]|nr:hypothetical protein [Candidatus Woesearchaeota archaeon]